MSGPVDEAIERFTPFDPADYPHRLLFMPPRPLPTADVAIVWKPTPWPPDTVAGVCAALAGGGGVYLMARDQGELVRLRESLELLLSQGGNA